MQLHEKYRPQAWADVVGQNKAIETIQRFKSGAGLAGRAFWISGKSGQGKTTIGKLIAQEVADPFYTDEMDAGELNCSRLSDIERVMHLYGAGSKTGRAFIFNESHGLRKAVVRQFLVLLERLPRHIVVVFTTTIDGMELFEEGIDASPLLSRCECISLAQRDIAQAFAKRAQEIARAENLDGLPIAAYLRLVNDCGGNMRAVLQKIEQGKMLNI
jgi:replication-associated recombination protein RarA